MSIAKFSKIEWDINPSLIKTVDGWDTELKVKTKINGNSGKQTGAGNELRKLTIPYKAYACAGVDIRKELETLKSILGVIAPLYINRRRFLAQAFMFEEGQVNNIELTPTGEILSCEISLSFVEVNKKCGTAGTRVYYNNTDITNDINIVECEHEMNAEDKPDTINIKFSDNKHLWDNWKPSNNDTIKIVDGIAKTGKMYIQNVSPENGYMNLTASSIPDKMRKVVKENNKSWQSPKFLQIVSEIAGRHGLSIDNCGVENRVIPFLEQENVSDLDFLSERCELEGCAFVIYDGKIVLYSPEMLEKNTPVKTIKVPQDADFKYTDNTTKGFGKCELDNGSVFGKASASNNVGNSKRKILEGHIDSQAEANFYAQNVLRKANRNLRTGSFKTAIMRDLSAASIAMLKTETASSKDGKVFYNKVRHDYVKHKTSHFFRFV